MEREVTYLFKRFFAYYLPYKGLFILDFSCAVCAALLELVFPLAVYKVVDNLLPSGNWSWIVLACIGLAAIYLLNMFLHYIVTYWGHQLGINIETDMRKKMFEHFQKLSFRYYDNTKTGKLMSRITNDLQEIGEMAHHGPEDLFIAMMTMLGAFSIMCTINWQLAVLTFIVIPLLFGLTIYFNKKMMDAFQKMMGDIAEVNARVEDSLGGIRVVKAFANEAYERKLFAKNNERFRLTKLFSYKIMARSTAVNYFLMRFITVFVLFFGTWFVLRGELSYGEFLAFLLLTNVFIGPITKINAIIESYPKGIAGFKRYLEILDTVPEEMDEPDAKEIKELKGTIQFINVSFGYEQKTPILKNINLTIQRGETIAFVGPSGAGKTTLCSLLPRFYHASNGKILIDGIDINTVKLSSLRKQIGIVQQDVFLFSGTIRENISYGKLEANEDAIWDAAKKAKLEDFILSQPNGLDTMIGERGVKLSGGQKQRLAIARMFLKNPPILILDEATSALDTETEAAIQQSLAELAKGRTTLIIAHRLATIKHADRIVVVTEEGITEQGKHDQLLAVDGMYSRLHQAQYS